MAQESFTYDPLPLHGDSIRVLRLHRGGVRDPIRCTLYTTSLKQAARSYDALSYAWGIQDHSEPILVNGGEMVIRRNLFAFLCMLRSPEDDIHLWADAVCIDQQNNREKNHQVQQMGRIYESSRITHVWLGFGSAKILAFMRLL